ncbi:putative pectinesterase/pectinesterase inhibitor 38 [Silene latifolia]|uniref:putative pectinesterase/pectinesterase inhibitor 38 n=1 Tax=Silene latifolia TaxID=37657 RepID=UPI003D77F0A3
MSKYNTGGDSLNQIDGVEQGLLIQQDTPRPIVSTDGSDTHSTIQEALDDAANRSTTPIKILIKNGIYYGHVVVPVWKSNIFLQGESSAETVITDKRDISDYGTDETSTFVVEAEGFVAQDLAILNTVRPEAGQAVAFKCVGDRTILHRCVVKEYQDILFAQRGRHFFRDSQIYGTVDFIFGDSQTIFQNCILYFRIPSNA